VSTRFEMTFSTSNDAFADGNRAGEIARILTQLADRLRSDGMAAFSGGVIRILDDNGNRVGFATCEAGDE
jgi:hypothetical protein